MTTPARLGLRVVGGPYEARRLVDLAAAFTGYAQCDPAAECNREGFLSAFSYTADMATHFKAIGSTAGYVGPIGAPFVWLDIDRGDLEAALTDARRLSAAMLNRYRTLDDDGPLYFHSGSKGFHVGLPTHNPPAGAGLNLTVKRFALTLAQRFNVAIDASVYGPVQLLRAPNSKHPKTGRHKRRLTFAELMNLSAARIIELARDPLPFDPLPSPPPDPQILDDWHEAELATVSGAAARASAHAATLERGRLSKSTRDFLRDGAEELERHKRLFHAAAELGDWSCPPALALALLSEPALDCGLAPSEVRRTVADGLRHADRQRGAAP